MAAREPSPLLAGATTVDGAPERGPSNAAPPVLALVIAWSHAEPERVGEIAIVPRVGDPLVLGRGEGDPSEARLRFFRQRPTGLTATMPLSSPGLSRRQLRIQGDDARLRVEQLGRSALLVNGDPCDAAFVMPGDTVLLRGELLLLCVERQAAISPMLHFARDAEGAFGEPDALGIVGESPAAWRLREEIAFSAKAAVHVLIHGDSGTGKELAARAVHALSLRGRGPFVARNAATLPPGLIDAELFGNAKNYPNPGMAERPGLIGQSDGGTLFLDEVGELPTELQAHLLRVLDGDGEYQRLGESVTRRSSFKLIAATNKPMGELKHDLLARLAARIELPSLSSRREDVPLLVRHLLLRAARRSPEIAARFVIDKEGRSFVRVSSKLVEHFVRANLDANAREIEAGLWKSLSECTGDELFAPSAPSARATPDKPAAHAERKPEAHLEVRDVEPTREAIREALVRANNSVTRAARALGLSSRFALYRLLEKHGIERVGNDK